MSLLWVILGFILLVVGGEFLVRSSVALSFKFSISKMVIGMTVVSFATSAPELLVSLQAALSGSPAIAINNVVGSNIANIGLVLGITAIVGAISVDKSFYKVNWPVMMLFSIALYYFLKNDSVLVAFEGAILFVGLILFLFLLIRNAKNDTDIEEVDESLAVVSNFKIGVWLLIGATALYFGSEWLVDGAKDIATSIGVSEAVIGVSLIAIGTSVPELITSVVAAFKKHTDISVGNLIGSNIFNILGVVGITAMVKEIPVSLQVLTNDIYWVLGISLLVFPLMIIGYKINRLRGFALFAAYCIYIYFVVS